MTRRPGNRPSLGRAAVVAGILALGIAAAGLAQEPYQVSDVDATPILAGPSSPRWLASAGGVGYLYARRPDLGYELWRSDGTIAGTTLVKDICPGRCDSYPFVESYETPRRTLAAGDTLYFSANDGVHGRELWRTDGSEAGTRLMADLTPGCADTTVIEMIESGGTLFFTVDRSAVHAGWELWKSDGTEAGSVLIRRFTRRPSSMLNPPPGVESLTAAGATIFFLGYEAATGLELWKSDGTPAGTVLVKDIYPGPLSSGFDGERFAVLDGNLYFTSRNGIDGYELWRSDGTVAGTFQVTHLVPDARGSLPDALTVMNGALYFTALTSPDPGGWDLWRSDGTEAGTTLVRYADPGPGGPNWLAVEGGALYFAALGRIWISDGTAAGTVPLATVAASWLAGVNGTLYFAGDEGGGRDLWRSDGTPAGTKRVAGLRSPGLSALTALTRGVLFVSGSGADTDLWFSDGTEGGTGVLPIDETGGGTESSGVVRLEAVGDRVFFLDDRLGGLWRSDGTASGTQFLAGGLRPGRLTALGTGLLFVASDPASGWELWRSDGTGPGTVQVKDICTLDPTCSGLDSADGLFYEPPQFPVIGGKALFAAVDNGSARELWRSDGTQAGTSRVKDINPGQGDATPRIRPGVVAGGSLYFTADDGTHGRELWRSDGTEPGTLLVADLTPGASGTYISLLGAAGDRVVFTAGVISTDLFATDGTATRTVKLVDALAVTEFTFGPRAAPLAGVLYFAADAGGAGSGLWRSDGTVAGTALVHDFAPGTVGPNPYFTASGGRLYFAATDLATGTELWSSDGTEAGTVQAADIRPGPEPSDPERLFEAGGTLYFVASDCEHGRELWKSDGTGAGTVRVSDICPGLCDAFAHHDPYRWLVRAGDRLMFPASDGLTGTELWALDVTPAVQLLRADQVTSIDPPVPALAAVLPLAVPRDVYRQAVTLPFVDLDVVTRTTSPLMFYATDSPRTIRLAKDAAAVRIEP